MCNFNAIHIQTSCVIKKKNEYLSRRFLIASLWGEGKGFGFWVVVVVRTVLSALSIKL